MSPARTPYGDTTYDAPVGSIDLAAFNDDGEPYSIWPCADCLPWHVEVIRRDDGHVFVREWHAIGCEHFQSLLSDDDPSEADQAEDNQG